MIILRACVADRGTIARLAAIASDVRFKTKHARLIFGWCLEHFTSYDDAPGAAAVNDCFAAWLIKNPEDNASKRLEDFLNQLDGTQVNPEYVADKVGEYFSRLSLEELSNTLSDNLQIGQVNEAAAAVSAWRPVAIGSDESIDVLRDKEALQIAFADAATGLIRYPSGLGNFFQDELARSSFVAFMGPEKRGKTFWLMDVAWRGMMSKCRVAFFGLGDMTRSQYMMRWAVRASRRPRFSHQELPIPKSIEWSSDRKTYTLVSETRQYAEALQWGDASRAMDKVMSHSGSLHPLLKMSTHANSTMGVSDIEQRLDLWEKDGWVPDVIVVDYADLLLAPRGATDDRDANNRNWKQLRKMSQERHCLVVTATQAAASSYDAYVITKRHFSEDKRKLAHVTAMVGLNQTDSEKIDGVMRLNWIVRRDNDYSEYQCCLAAGQPKVGNLAICSHFR